MAGRCSVSGNMSPPLSRCSLSPPSHLSPDTVTEPARCPQQPIIAPVSSSSHGGSHDNFIGVTLHPARGQTAPNQADTGITRSSPHQQSASRHQGVISLGPGDTAEADILLPFYWCSLEYIHLPPNHHHYTVNLLGFANKY